MSHRTEISEIDDSFPLPLPLVEASDIVKETVEAGGLEVYRSRRADGVELQISSLKYRSWQVLVAIFFFPIGLLALAAGKFPHPQGAVRLTTCGDSGSAMRGTTGNRRLDERVLDALGVF
jgi:hypothetical protein